MSPTIKDVANKANVSLSTVSLVLNHKTNVRPHTRKKVEDAIADLNYHPRRNARGLASKKTHNIGFILTEDHFSQAEPFYTKIFLGTEFEARKFHYYILLTTIQNNFKVGFHVPRFLLEKNVDGVILAGKVPKNLIDYIQKIGLPLVIVDYNIRTINASNVFIDNFQGAQLAVTHLIKNGHRQIAFIGGELNHPSISERHRGYIQTLNEHNLPKVEKLISVSQPKTGLEDGYEATRKLLDTGITFTAIVTSNDTMAVGAMRCLKENNFKIPQDVSIIGFDDIEACIQVEPRLSTVKVYKEEIGAIAVRRIVEKIENNKLMNNQIIVPVELMLRESSGQAPVYSR